FLFSAHDREIVWLCSRRFGKPRPGPIAGFGDEAVEDRLRERIPLPSHFRVPLDTEHEMIGSCVDYRFDYAVVGPRYCLEIAADQFNRLMVMTIDHRLSRTGKLSQQ